MGALEPSEADRSAPVGIIGCDSCGIKIAADWIPIGDELEHAALEESQDEGLEEFQDPKLIRRKKPQ